MADFQPAPRKKIAFDNRSLNLYSMENNADNKKANIAWGYNGNRVVMTIWTNEEADKQSRHKGRIEVKLELPAFYYMMEVINKAIEAPGEFLDKFSPKDFVWMGGKERSKERLVKETIVVGKDRDGEIWISLSAKDRPKFKFGLTPNEQFYNFVDAQGNPKPKAEVAAMWSRGYVKLMLSLAGELAVSEYEEPKPKQPRGNGGYSNGGYNGGGNSGGNSNYGGNGNGGNGNSNYGEIEDTIPF